MKFISFLFLLINLSLCVAQGKSPNTKVIGTMLDSNFINSKIYLSQSGGVLIDSIIPQKGKFEFVIKRNNFPSFYIHTTDKDGSFCHIMGFVSDYNESVYVEIKDVEKRIHFHSSSLYNSRYEWYNEEIDGILRKHRHRKFISKEDSIKAQNDTENRVFQFFNDLKNYDQFYFLSIIFTRTQAIKLLEPKISFLAKMDSLLSTIDPKYTDDKAYSRVKSYFSINSVSLVGHFIKNYEFASCNGDSVSTRLFKDKKYILLNFWATWCVPCKPKNEYIEKNIEKYRKAGIEVIGIVIDNENKEKSDLVVKKTCSKINYSWRQGLLDNGKMSKSIMEDFRVETVPKVFLISKEGEIINVDMFEFEDVLKAIEKYEVEKNSRKARPSIF